MIVYSNYLLFSNYWRKTTNSSFILFKFGHLLTFHVPIKFKLTISSFFRMITFLISPLIHSYFHTKHKNILKAKLAFSPWTSYFTLTQLLNQISSIPIFVYEIVKTKGMLCTILLLFYDIFIYSKYLWLDRTHKPAEYFCVFLYKILWMHKVPKQNSNYGPQETVKIFKGLSKYIFYFIEKISIFLYKCDIIER